MSDAKHTPGPWAWYGPTRGEGLTFTHEAHVGPGAGNDSCGPIAAVGGDDDEQAVTNARLIAASPDLLASLEELVLMVGPDHPAAVRAREAIAKAKGGAA